jgi:hypothetical protein
MPNDIRVCIQVSTPQDHIGLTRYADAAPRITTGAGEGINADSDAATATELLGKVADEVLTHFGYTDAFAQYVGIASVLNDNDNGADGVHVRGVRELSAMVGRLAAERDAARAKLDWMGDPSNWRVHLRHGRDPGEPVREDFTVNHGSLLGLPAATLTRFAQALLGRINTMIDVARDNDEVARAGITEIVEAVLSAEAQQARYRVVLQLRPQDGATDTGEGVPVRPFLLTPEAQERMVATRLPELPPVEKLIFEASRREAPVISGGAPEPPEGVRAVRRVGDLRHGPEPLDILFRLNQSSGLWHATGENGDGGGYRWDVVNESDVFDCSDESRYTVIADPSGTVSVRDSQTGEHFEVESMPAAWRTIAALHDAATPPVIAEKRRGKR